MTLENNFSITRLFVTKDVDIVIKEELKEEKRITIHLRTIRDFYEDNDWNIALNILTKNAMYKVLKTKEKISNFAGLKLILFNLGQYDKFRRLYTILIEQFNKIFIGFQTDINTQEIKIQNVTITEEIWDYIVYIIKLSNGEKVAKPLTFSSEEARKFYLAQQENEERIRKLKAQKGGDTDALSKHLLAITYAFPSLSIDYLLNQTMAQIQWLQRYAAGAMSYEVNAKAYAAGNMKKGKKLDFFIK